MVVVLVLAAGAVWESEALGLLGRREDVVVLKRCVDVSELLASASAGQAHVAVVALEGPGLDRAAIDHLRQAGVRPVAVIPGGAAREAAALRASRIGVRAMVTDEELTALPDLVAAGKEPDDTVLRGEEPQPGSVPISEGRVIAVWGPTGAPGRTTVATGLAAELARRERRTVLIDADPYGGAVAQMFGIVDEISGLLAAARAAGQGDLEGKLGGVQRALDHRLSVVTGLPRADRYAEVRPGVLELLIDLARGHGDVVLDTGFCLESDPRTEIGGRGGRNHMTLAALAAADEVVVVGSADPVGLSRLARGLVEVRDAGVPEVRVVINRMRASLGWSERDLAGMVEGFTRLEGLHFLPEDRAAVDRALVAGKTVIELGDSALGRGLAGLAAAVAGAQAANSR
jgi:MinD-like ATPase involved in chromosome partitioning or flagellar assembly